MGEESIKLIYDCDNKCVLRVCVNDEIASSDPPPTPYTQPTLHLSPKAGPLDIQAGPCPTQVRPHTEFPSQATTFSTCTGPFPTQTCPFPTQTCPFPTQTSLLPTETCPFPTHPTQTCSFPTQTTLLPTETCPFLPQTVLFPTQTGNFTSHTGPIPTPAVTSHALTDPTQSDTLTQSGPLSTHSVSTQTEPYFIDKGPSHPQQGPSQSKNMFQLKTVAVECKKCKKTFLTLKGLRQHIETTHSGDPSFIECDHDGRRFIRVDSFQEDKNEPSHRKPDNTCSKCGKWFTSASSMNRHSRLYCSSLRQESLLDTVEEPVAVGSDGGTHEAQAQPTVVQLGPSTSHSEQPSNLDNGHHRCPKCGQEYIQKRNLTRHLRFECGVPPQFRCSQCDFKSNHKFNLKAHVLNVHKSEYTK